MSSVQMSRSLTKSASVSRCQKTRHVVRASSDKLVQRPEMKRPDTPAEEPAKKLFDPPTPVPMVPQASTPTPIPRSVASTAAGVPGVITVDYQRMRAKEMTKYFREVKAQQLVQSTGSTFGWTRPNEISNGRWTMFGLLVGMMTEYATGVDFPHQITLLASYLGLFDAE